MLRPSYNAHTIITPCAAGSGSGSGGEGGLPLDRNMSVDLNCRDDFVMINSSCQPRCDRWEQSSHWKIVFVTVVELFAAILGLSVGIVVIVSSIIRRKNMYVEILELLLPE